MMPAGGFNRNRTLSIEDSFHRKPRQKRWSTGSGITVRRGRSLSNVHGGGRRFADDGNSRRIVRRNSNDVSSDCADTAATEGTSPAWSSSSSAASGKGRQMLKSVVGFLSRAKCGKSKSSGGLTTTVPASPASAASSNLSRTNSDASAQDGVEGRRTGGGGYGGSPKPRVSFDMEVQTVYIEQMEEEEVRNTFYCRSDYAAFKEAYRMHRDTSVEWCRGNDVLPCNCDACQDDLVDGAQRGWHAYSSLSGSAAGLPDDDDDNYDNAFDDPAVPPSPFAQGHKDRGDVWGAAVSMRGGGGDNECGDGEDVEQADDVDAEAPPSPAGAVFEDDSSSSSSNESGFAGRKPSRTMAPRSFSAPSSSFRSSSARQGHPSHRRRVTWGLGSVPIAEPANMVQQHGSSLDWGEGVTASVREAVKCHGEGYAYKTLRLQGFSDLYIRTHFLPEP